MPSPVVIGREAFPRVTVIGLKTSCSPRRMKPVISPPFAHSLAAVQLHLRGRKNCRAGAALADDNRKSLCPDNGGNLKPSLKSADVRELDLQKIRCLFFEHRECIFRRADAFLSGDRNAYSAT